MSREIPYDLFAVAVFSGVISSAWNKFMRSGFRKGIKRMILDGFLKVPEFVEIYSPDVLTVLVNLQIILLCVLVDRYLYFALGILISTLKDALTSMIVSGIKNIFIAIYPYLHPISKLVDSNILDAENQLAVATEFPQEGETFHHRIDADNFKCLGVTRQLRCDWLLTQTFLTRISTVIQDISGSWKCDALGVPRAVARTQFQVVVESARGRKESISSETFLSFMGEWYQTLTESVDTKNGILKFSVRNPKMMRFVHDNLMDLPFLKKEDRFRFPSYLSLFLKIFAVCKFPFDQVFNVVSINYFNGGGKTISFQDFQIMILKIAILTKSDITVRVYEDGTCDNARYRRYLVEDVSPNPRIHFLFNIVRGKVENLGILNTQVLLESVRDQEDDWNLNLETLKIE